jgi:hypothetical protein
VREASLGATAGREDAIVAVERTVGAAREQMRRILKDQDRG